MIEVNLWSIVFGIVTAGSHTHKPSIRRIVPRLCAGERMQGILAGAEEVNARK